MPKFVKCKNCQHPIAVDTQSTLLVCDECGKKYKNPYYVAPEDVSAPAPVAPVEPATSTEPVEPVTSVEPQVASTNYRPIERGKSEFQAGLMSLIGLKITNFFIMLFTLGFGTPIAICREYRWKCENEVIDGRKMVFDGKAGSLFGQWIKWAFFSIITLGIYAWTVPIKKMKWIAEHTHVEGEPITPEQNLSSFDGSFWSYLGERIICYFIITFTLGLCTPVAICRMYNWELEHKKVDGHRLVFNGKAGSLIGQWIKWMLLSLITLSIYSWWVPIKKQQWITSHTHFEA